MKKLTYFLLLSLILSTLCACGDDKTKPTNEVTIENSGIFSEELHIEPSTDVTIIEMP